MAGRGRLAGIPTMHFGDIHLTWGAKATLTFITGKLSIPLHIMHKVSLWWICVRVYILYVWEIKWNKMMECHMPCCLELLYLPTETALQCLVCERRLFHTFRAVFMLVITIITIIKRDKWTQRLCQRLFHLMKISVDARNTVCHRILQS